MISNGTYDFYTSGIKKYKTNSYNFTGPAITIAGNGATVGFMHRADGYFNAYQRTYVLSGFHLDRDFLFYAIKGKLPKKIKEESRTGNIPYIVLNMLTKLEINTSTNENEQNKISKLVNNIDQLIDSNEDKQFLNIRFQIQNTFA